MSFITTMPEEMVASSAGLSGIGAVVGAANASAAPMLNAVVPPAPEPASILLSAQFMVHAGMHQVMQGIGSAMHAMFIETLSTSAASYGASEASNLIAML
jgi:hypothetical protein